MKTNKSLYSLLSGAMILPFLCGCMSDKKVQPNHTVPAVIPVQAQIPSEITVTPKSIPGTPRAENNNPTGGYAPTSVQTQFKIDVQEGTKELKVIRDNTDPYVITKPYILKNADPYAVRSYLEAAVGAKSVSSSPAQVTAVKYDDGSGVVLVSAEDYRFHDSEDGRGIDSIVEALDKKGLTSLPDADTHVYFPRISRASNLREMLRNSGSSELDPQFETAPGSIIADGELNALVVKASKWNWNEMLSMLKQYDKPIPEIRVTYKILEIYAENDDRIGVDFQTWKNNDGVDLFAAGTFVKRNWDTFFTSGVLNNGSNRTSYWKFDPKWNTRYLDFMTSIGKAKILTKGSITARNRETSTIQVNSGFFYDRTYYTEGASSIAEATKEFAYTEPNPNAIQRSSIGSIIPSNYLNQAYKDMGVSSYLTKAGYTLRMMGTQVTTAKYYDAIAKAAGNDAYTSGISKYLTGFVKADGTVVDAAYDKTNWNTVDASPGIIHGWLQYPMVTDGFSFCLNITPVVTGKAAQMKFELSCVSLLGWNSDGSARSSKSGTSTTVQLPYESQDFVIGGLRKSESVRGTAGLPFVKDLPVIGRLFSTETESLKQSQLVLIACVEYVRPDTPAPAHVKESIGKITDDVNAGMKSRVGNMFFQQYLLDDDREARIKRLDEVGNIINDEFESVK